MNRPLLMTNPPLLILSVVAILLRLSAPEPLPVSAWANPSKQIPAPIRDYLSSECPEGAGPLMILGWIHSDLDDDEEAETVVLYEYQIGASRDRTHTRYLIVLWHRDGQLTANEPEAIGFVGSRLPEELRLNGEEILIKGLLWAGEDPLCCPSERYSQHYLLRGRRLLRRE